MFWDRVPRFSVLCCCVVNSICRVADCCVRWYVVIALLRVSGGIFMDLGHRDVVMVMLWSVELAVLVDEGMHFCAYSEGVEVEDVE